MTKLQLRPSGPGQWRTLPLEGRPLAISNTGLCVVASGFDATSIRQWKVINSNDDVLHQADEHVQVASFSPDDRRLAVLNNSDKKLWIYDTETFEKVSSQEATGIVLSYDDEGTRLALCHGDHVSVFDAESLQYLHYIKFKSPQSIHFYGNELHIGGYDNTLLIEDLGEGKPSSKRPKAKAYPGWALDIGTDFGTEGSVVITTENIYDRATQRVLKRNGYRCFSTVGRTLYDVADDGSCSFRRLGETRIFTTTPKEPQWGWHASTDGTHIAAQLSGETAPSVWAQTEFPDKPSPAPVYELPKETPPGFQDDAAFAHVVYGCVVELPYAKVREVADAVFAKGELTWAAIPAGDATEATTGYEDDDDVEVAIGLTIAQAQGLGQGETSPPTAIKAAQVKAAAKAWEEGIDALRAKLGLPLENPETLLVATGCLSYAIFRRGSEEVDTQDIVPITIPRSGKVMCVFD